jgi:HSP20 family protein
MSSRKPPLSMWADACELLDRAERLQRQFFHPGRAAAWEPPVDVYETARDLWVVVALPGVGAAQLEIAVADGAVIVAGERRLPAEARATIHRLEIPHGRFERRIALPAGRYELDRRDLADGCLVIGLRKLS